MFSKKNLIFILLFCVCYPGAVSAKSYFVEQFKLLEKEVRRQWDLPFLAKKLSEVGTFEQWPQNMDHNLRLYIAIQWLDQNHVKPALHLMSDVEPESKHEDLLKYYRAAAQIYLGQVKQAGLLLSHLEKEHSRDADFLYLKSVYLAETNDLAGAIALMDATIRQESRKGKFYLQRGIYRMLAFSHDDAVKDFLKAVRYLPKGEVDKRQQAYLQVGLIFLKIKGDQKKGLEYIRKGTSLAPASDLMRQVNQVLR